MYLSIIRLIRNTLNLIFAMSLNGSAMKKSCIIVAMFSSKYSRSLTPQTSFSIKKDVHLIF